MVTRRAWLCGLGGTALVTAAEEWIPLFDGRTLKGWRASESQKSWSVQDGCLHVQGPRSHLFYDGPVREARFKNFELEAEVMTWPAANSGIFFHTTYQEAGFPQQGFEVQINNTHVGAGSYRERKKTGSLYGVRNVYPQLARDNEWFKLNVLVRGKNAQIRVNGTLVVDYTEADPPLLADGGRQRVFSAGTFALQGHDPGSRTKFRTVRVRPLADDARAEGASQAQSDETARQLLLLSAHNYPVVDYHVHLKGGLTLEDVLYRSRETGIGCGIAVNCGKGFPVENEAGARAFADSLRGKPVFAAMQAEGREWVEMFPRVAAAQFDYIFTDSMTWTDNRGKRMRLWMSEEVGRIGDADEFMETLVARAVGILEREPVDIYVNPTFLPAPLDKNYDALWTDERMRKVIRAAKTSDVALELNDRYKLPGERFVRMAKEEGLKFSFGTNNAGASDWGRSQYGIEMIRRCNLAWSDFFVPKPRGERAIDRRGSVLKS